MRKVNLKALRLQLGLTQQQVADKAKLSRSYYSMLENDINGKKHSPPVERIKALSDVLGFAWEDYYETAE